MLFHPQTTAKTSEFPRLKSVLQTYVSTGTHQCHAFPHLKVWTYNKCGQTFFWSTGCSSLCHR